MVDKRTAPVESYKIPAATMQFQRKYKNLKRIQEILQLRTLQISDEAENVRQMWQTLEGEFQMLQPPKEPVRELQGMNFGEENAEPQQGGSFVNELEQGFQENTKGIDTRLKY